MRVKLAAGNWKMNGLGGATDMALSLNTNGACEVLICPPATLITRLSDIAPDGLLIGGQDCHINETGAHTGDISAEMIRDAGGSHVIVGHSERRTDHGETDVVVAAKTQAAWRGGLTAVVCIGETEAQYKAGETLQVIAAQLAGSLPTGTTHSNTVIAYEPVWAIGTGLVPTLDEIQAVHAFVRAEIGKNIGTDAANGMRILYGGSVKPGNAAEIFSAPDVDGALVGGASLKAEDFNRIIEALNSAG